MSETSMSQSDVQAPAEDGLIGYSRSPHPQILLKIAIAINDGTPFIGWVAGLYSKEAFDFLIWIHDKIAASTLAECDAQDFSGGKASWCRVSLLTASILLRRLLFHLTSRYFAT